jgi:hypothetical protein
MKINKTISVYSPYLKTTRTQEAEIQLQPILDIFLRGFSLSSCPQHSPKVLLLLNLICLLKQVLSREQNFSYFDPDYPTSGLTAAGLARVSWI